MGLVSDSGAPLRIFRTGVDAFAADVPQCTSCVQPHPKAPIVLKDGQVYYRCERTSAIVFIREQRKGAK